MIKKPGQCPGFFMVDYCGAWFYSEPEALIVYGRSTLAGPVTRHVPLLLTILVSAAIHVLLLAAGWALIRTNHESTQDSSFLSLTLGPTEFVSTAPAEPDVVPDVTPATSPETPAVAEAEAEPEPAPVAVAAVEQIVTTVADSLPAPASASTAPAMEMLPEMRMLSSPEQVHLQQVLEHLADPDILATAQAGDAISLPDGSPFAVDVRAVTTPGLTDLASYEVTLTQQQDDQLFSTRALLRERAFSWYAKFINRWDADVILANDRVVGRFHSNTPVNFSTDRRQQPVFSGPVSVAGYQGISRPLRDSGMFQQGLETGVGRVSMPGAVAPAVFALAEQALEVHQFTENTRLEFLADGGFGWFQSGARSGIIRPAPGNAMLVVADESVVLELSGIVNGVVSVFAPRRLSIIGNLTYAEELAVENDQQHFLTLISNGIIEVASPAQTGPGDLEVHAALFARQRFSVIRFSSRPQGELIIRGALVAGSVSATEPRYSTRIEYDARFESMRPPAFPTTGRFDIADWDQQWHITDVADGAPAIVPGMTRPVAVE